MRAAGGAAVGLAAVVLAAVVLAAVVLAAVVLAAGPTTRPSELPIRRWFEQLGDADPRVRDEAHDRLMGLPADRLPALLAVVRGADHPLGADRGCALHEVVTHVFLTAEAYDPLSTDDGVARFILGQSWPDEVKGDERAGVPVVNRWPGFPARRALRDGDLILGLYADPAAPPGLPPDLPTRTTGELVVAMLRCPSRPRLAMSVLRDGSVRRVTVDMVPEPAQTVDRGEPTTAFLADRQRRADDYWRATFAQAVGAAEP